MFHVGAGFEGSYTTEDATQLWRQLYVGRQLDVLPGPVRLKSGMVHVVVDGPLMSLPLTTHPGSSGAPLLSLKRDHTKQGHVYAGVVRGVVVGGTGPQQRGASSGEDVSYAVHVSHVLDIPLRHHGWPCATPGLTLRELRARTACYRST